MPWPMLFDFTAGAAHVIVSDEEDVARSILEITGKHGARMVFDPVCGPGVEALASAVSDYGIMFLYGALAGVAPTFPLYPALQKNLTLRGHTLFVVTEFPEALEVAKKFVLDGLASGAFKPVIAKTFPSKRSSQHIDTSSPTSSSARWLSRSEGVIRAGETNGTTVIH